MSEPNFQTTKFFTENLLAIEMEKIEILMNRPVYLGPSKLELSNILMYEFWYDYTKPKYGENAKVCYMDTDSFIIYVKTDDIYKDTAEDVETRFYTSNFELDRLLPKGKNKEDVLNTSSALQSFVFQDVLKTSCKYVLKKSSKTKKFYVELVMKMP